MGPFPPVPDSVNPGSTLLMRTLGHLELLPPLSDPAHAEATLSVRASMRPEAVAPTCNCCHSGVLLLLRSYAKSGFPALASDLCEVGSSTPVRSFLQPDSGTSASDAAFMEFTLSLRSFQHAGLAIPMADVAQAGLSSAVRAPARTEAFLFTFGLHRLELSMAVCDLCLIGSSSFIQRLACSGFRTLIQDRTEPGMSMPASDFSDLPFLPLRCFSRVGSPILAPGFSTPGSLPSALDSLHLGSLMSLKNMAHFGLALSLSDSATLGASPPTQCPFRFDLLPSLTGKFVQKDGVWNVGDSLLVTSSACLDPVLPVPCFARSGSMLLVSDNTLSGLLPFMHSFCRFASSLLIMGHSRPEVSAVLLDPATAGPFVPLRQLARVDSALPPMGVMRMDLPILLLDHALAGFLLPAQQLGYLGLSVFACSFAHAGFPSSFLEWSLLELPSLARNFACSGLPSPTLQVLLLGLPMFSRSRAQPEPSPSTSTISRIESKLPLLDHTDTDAPPPARSLSRLDSPLSASGHSSTGTPHPALDLLHLDSSPSPQRAARPDPYTPIFGRARSGPTASPCDRGCLATSMFLRSASKSDAAAPSVEMVALETSASAKTSAKLGLATLVVFRAQCGTFLTTLDVVQLEFLLSLHSFACLAFCSFVMDFAELDAPVSARAPTRPASPTMTIGMVCTGLSFPLPDLVPLSASMPAHGLVCSDLVLPVPDPVSSEPAVLVRQPGRRSSSLPVSCAARLAVSASILDFLGTEPFSSLQNHAWPELRLSLMSWLAVGPASSSRPALHPGSFFPAYTSMQPGEFLLVLDYAFLGSLMSVRSFAKLGLAPLLLDTAQTGLLPPARNKLQPGFISSAAGRMCSDDALSAFLFPETGLLLFVRQFFWPDFSMPAMGRRLRSAMPVLDLSFFGSAMFLRNALCAGISPPLPGCGRTDNAAFAPDNVCFESAPSFHSSVYFGVLTFLSDSINIESPLLVRQLAHAGGTWAQGLTRLCFLPSIIDFGTTGPLLLARQFTRVSGAQSALSQARLGSSLPALDPALLSSSFFIRGMMNLFNYLSVYNHGIRCKGVTPDSSLSVRSMFIFGPPFSICNALRAGELTPAMDSLHIGSVMPLQSPA